jgi:hypothetical protein
VPTASRIGPTRPEVVETPRKLDWMRGERIRPDGARYLWTDAFGVVLLVSLAEEPSRT